MFNYLLKKSKKRIQQKWIWINGDDPYIGKEGDVTQRKRWIQSASVNIYINAE